MEVFVLPVTQLNKKGWRQPVTQFGIPRVAVKEKKINRVNRQQNFVSVK